MTCSGTGRTALKGSVARYVAAETIGLNSLGNPMSALSTSDTRTWTDLNNDRTVFNPDFTLQQIELGPSTNQNFGRSVQTTTVDPEVLEGWGHRPYVYEVDLGFQHQLASRASTTAMFYHRRSGNHLAIANTAVSRADFTGPFCVTAPADARLPDGGGYPVCGLYDVNRLALGRVAELVTAADNLGSGVNSRTPVSRSPRTSGWPRRIIQGGLDIRRDRAGHVRDRSRRSPGRHPVPDQWRRRHRPAADRVRQPGVRGWQPGRATPTPGSGRT